MQVVKKIVIGIFVLWLAFLVFMPKSELYYLLEKELAKSDIKLNETSIEEGFFSLKLRGVKLFVKGIHIADIQNIEIMTLLGYTTLQIDEVVVDDLLTSQAPKKIDKIDVVHSLLDVLHINIDANGSIGEVYGKVALDERKLRVDFAEVVKIRKIRKFLQKDAQGWYYEKTF